MNFKFHRNCVSAGKIGCLENDDLENDDLENDDLENDDGDGETRRIKRLEGYRRREIRGR